jgi:GNAT superfamily N-acetyltransferase
MRFHYVKELSPEHILEAQRDSHSLWSNGLSLDERLARLERRLAFADGSVLSMRALLDEGGQLLASLKCYSLQLSYKGQVLSTLGIGAVFTSPSQRGKGYAKELIDRVLDEAKTLEYRASILFSDIGPTYYKRFGFMDVPAHHHVVQVGDLPNADVMVDVRKAGDQDVPLLLALGDHNLRAPVIRSVRDENIWRYFRDQNGPVDDYILSLGQTNVGYMTLQESKTSLSIALAEWIVPRQFHEAALATIRLFCVERGLTHVESWQDFVGEFAPKKTTSRPKEIPMLASLNADVDFSDIKPDDFWFSAMDQF